MQPRKNRIEVTFLINQIIKEINTCLKNGCYIAALTTALTLPDICGKVEYPKDIPTSRYKKWYREWIGKYEKCPDDEDNMPYQTADLIHDLRNSLLHEGNPDVNLDKNDLTSFKLLITGSYMSGGIATVHKDGDGKTIGREIEIGIENLCFRLCRTAEMYYKENKDKFKFNYTIVNGI